ncbi:hypothetical protein GT037_004216 [Alternaria burnsii]|uniref:Uncharacterized protein n=1 Tax=Alternaria burnsii TaxID=1187904 RepID=A0A8H7B8J2_9PLEO|nr:uncharacterized protein GT037_004216 [Alternaria burnsii]KAF7677357.1 hypothetical protein GT037_004216 [Alternaria burnsii]
MFLVRHFSIASIHIKYNRVSMNQTTRLYLKQRSDFIAARPIHEQRHTSPTPPTTLPHPTSPSTKQTCQGIPEPIRTPRSLITRHP